MAPEIIEARDSLTAYTAEADAYSTGVVVWECLTSEHPFEEGGRRVPRRELIALILSGGRPDCDRVQSVRMTVALEAIWRQDPAERASLKDLHAALQKELQVLTLPLTLTLTLTLTLHAALQKELQVEADR